MFSLFFFFHLFCVLWISDCLPTPSQKLFKTPFKFSTYSSLSENVPVPFFPQRCFLGLSVLFACHLFFLPASAILGVLSVSALQMSLPSSFCWIPCLFPGFHVLLFLIYPLLSQGFPGGSDRKASACNAGDPGSILCPEDPLEKEMATHSSILAWKIPWSEEPDRLQSLGLQRVRHD